MATRGSRGGTPAILSLERAGVPCVVHEFAHDPAERNYGRAAAHALGVDETRVFKTLLAEADGLPVVAIVPVACQLSLKQLASALGKKRAQMMDPAAAERLTGYVVGGISPIGQKKRSITVLDASASESGTIFVSGGRRGLDLELAPGDLVRLLDAITAPIAAP